MPKPAQSEVLARRPLERQLKFQFTWSIMSSWQRLPKIEEILQTGELRRINYEKTKDVEVGRLFQGIYGVGMIYRLSNFVPI